MSDLSEIEQRMLNAINAWRAERGRASLAVDAALQAEARRSAPHFAHKISGRWAWERLQASGWRGFATDNIAMGYETPEEAVEGWGKEENSVGHDRQMLGFFRINGEWIDQRWDVCGVGATPTRRYIAIFGRREP